MKYEKSCGVIAFDAAHPEPKILLICHRYGGHWAFPKGHVEAGETETQTALRELKEETGATAELIDGYREMTTYSPGRGITKDVVLFVGRLRSANLRPQPEEVRAAKLVPYSKALTQLSYEADRALLQKAHPYIFAKSL